jgi:hypothetical protein
MTTNYDPAVIQRFADRLYARARTIVIVYAVIGLIMGGLVGAIAVKTVLAQRSARTTAEAREGGLTFAFAAGGLIAGVFLGRERAFSLRLQAQTALCQKQIEQNTRRGELG